jgi:glucokinase
VSSPATPLDGRGRVLAVDCGGTEVKAGVVSADGAVHAEQRVASREAEGLDAWSAATLRAARRTLAAWPGGPPARLGLSVPGAVDPVTTTLVDLVARLPMARRTSLAELFAPLGLPVAADNDARAALAAERRWGAARGVDDVVLLTVGTGLGGAALVRGASPGGDPVLAASQLGHLSIDLGGEPCVCGNVGCAEGRASGPGLVRLAAGHGVVVPDAGAVFEADLRGVPGAATAVEEFTVALAAAIVNAIHAYQPSLVVLGGGVMRSADRFMPALRELVARRAWTIPRNRVRVEASPLGDRLGVLGAAAVAFRPTGPLAYPAGTP